MWDFGGDVYMLAMLAPMVKNTAVEKRAILPKPLGEDSGTTSCSGVLTSPRRVLLVLGKHRVDSSEAGTHSVLLQHFLGYVLSLGPRRPQRTNGATGKKVQARHARHDGRQKTDEI